MIKYTVPQLISAYRKNANLPQCRCDYVATIDIHKALFELVGNGDNSWDDALYCLATKLEIKLE